MSIEYIDQIPLPACVVDASGNVVRANSLMKNVFVYEDIVGNKFFTLTGLRREDLMKVNQEEKIIERNDRLFKIRTNENPEEREDIAVFFDEATTRETLKNKLEDERAVIVYINIDNYDELISNSPGDGKKAIASQIDSIVRKWGWKYGSPVISTGDDSYVMYTNSGKMRQVVEENFRVLDEVRAIESQIDFPASVSIGAGMSAVSLLESSELAGAALELALGRGGDQAVLKTDDGTKYYGGTLQAIEKSNRAKSRVIAHAMRALIEDADRVLIMGHRWPDMDSFGSAIAASCICRYLGKESFIVIEKHNEALDLIYDQALETEDYNLIKPEKALKMITKDTLLIIVDVNRPVLVESMDIVRACNTRVIIDHHRMTEDSFQKTSVAYIESYASSASELMAELLQHFSQKRFINKFEAEAMLAGIMVDSNNFSGRTGVRTFEAASWLRRAGADTTEVKRFFQMNPLDFKTKAASIADADFTEYGVAYAINGSTSGNTNIINAQVADELLMVKGVRATFVLGTNEKGQTIVSARSLGGINVQSMMEKFGGGGHFTSAAAQIEDTIENVSAQLRKMIKDSIDKENSENDRNNSN